MPRFLLVAGRKTGDSSTPRWPGGLGALVGETGPEGTWISWRLASANNRELGRSARVFANVDACRESIVSLRAGAAQASSMVAMDYITGLWRWQLAIDSMTVAVSARAYQRERECVDNLRQFLSAAVVAYALSEGPLPRLR